MGYFGFMGMNNVGGFGPYGGLPPGANGLPPANHADGKMGAGHGDSYTSSEGKKPHKTGISGFFQGVKNGLVNTVKGLFTVKGILMTTATMGLVAATGGAALLPLALVGMGLGGTQVFKGIKNGNSEQVGEGAFMMGASLGGVKLSPKTIGNETLTDPTLWGKIKAPFIGKGAFTNPDITYWSNTKAVTANRLNSWHDSLFGRPAIKEADGSITEAKQGWFGKTANYAKSGQGFKDTKRWITSAPTNPSPNGGNPQAPTPGPYVPFTERAQNYLSKIKNSPHTASSYMGALFTGNATHKKPEEAGPEMPPNNIGTFYY